VPEEASGCTASQSKMPFTIPSGLEEVWAKSPEAGRVSGETLVEHTYRVLERMADQYKLRPELGDCLGSDRFWHRAFWAGFFHDFGKATEGFQIQLRPNGKSWGQRHEVLSLAFVGWAFPEDSEDWIWITSTIVSHHRDLDYIRQRYPLNLDPDYDVIPQMLDELPNNVIEVLREWTASAPAEWIEQFSLSEARIELPELTGPESPQEFRIGSLERIRRALAAYQKFVRDLEADGAEALKTLTALAHRGVMMTADHAGSAHATEFPKNPIPAPDDLVRKIKLSNLYAHQELCREAEGSVMFAAPTGSGKTEAALLWTARQSANGGAPRVYYVLPFQASMNAMRERLSNLFPRNVGLQHGKSRFALYRMFLEAEQTPKQAAKNARFADALTRLHYYPVRILSPYQMLSALYRLKGYESTLTDVFSGVFIFDEIHAYEVKRLALILQMMEYLGRNYGAKFCIMSATFPDILKNWLSRAIPGLCELCVPEDLFESFRRHRVVLLDGELESDFGIQKIIEAAGWGSVLVCCNTVRRAQNVYRRLKEGVDGELRLELLHGRFNAKDRIGKERKLLAQMSTGLKPDAKGTVLVATQVVEVSLDIDFDTIFTEPAPLDALLQRFGRVNRGRRYPLRDVHVFREPREDTIIYDDLLVARTLDVLERANRQPIDEGRAKDWLDEIYAGEVSERWTTEFEEASRIFRRACTDRLFPYQSDEELGERFYEMFDGTEVVPSCFEQEFFGMQETDPLAAGELPVTVSWVQFSQLNRTGLVKPSDKWPKVVDVPYDEEFGLRLDAVDA
jgi:CRISPR-associated endonuclease/helicase Cas3